MKTELWIIFAQDGMGHVTLAGTYEVENDPLPGLRQVLNTIDPECLNSTHFFATRVKDGAEVSLHHINALPTIEEAEVGGEGHSNSHCGGCRDGHTSRTEHVCEERS